jgi:hypothetical protein
MAATSITIDGHPAPLATVGRRGPMNFGQNWRGVPMVEARYVLTAPVALVVAAIDATRGEFRADAEQHPDPDDALEQAWRRLGWAAGRDAVKDAHFLRAFVEFEAAGLLDAALGSTPSTPVWFLNTVDDAWSTGGQVVLAGVAGRRPSPDERG